MDDFEKYLDFQQKLAESKLEIIKKFKEENKEKRTSKIEIIERILKEAGRPLHVTEIINIAYKEYNVLLNRDSVTSSLTKKIKSDNKLLRTSPNTFLYVG